MKSATYALSLLLAAAAGPALGNCQDGTNKLDAIGLTNTLGGNTACNPPTGPYENQEFHMGTGSGPIFDFKKGNTDPIDPTVQVGTYSISGTAPGTIAYNYGGSTFVYTVATTGTAGLYDFCASTGQVLSIRIATGNSGCG